MLLNVASLIRNLSAAIQTTDVANKFIQVQKDLIKEIPAITRGIIKPELKEEACDKLANAYLAFIQKVKGHGLSQEKATEMVDIIEGLQKKNDFKGLVGYPYQFALAWKAPVNLKE
jgi:hypothetical protein